MNEFFRKNLDIVLIFEKLLFGREIFADGAACTR